MNVYYQRESRALGLVDTVYIPEFKLWAELFRGQVERYKDVTTVFDDNRIRVLNSKIDGKSDKLPEWSYSILKPVEAAKLRKAGYIL